MVTVTQEFPDPRFEMLSPTTSVTTTTPGGLVSVRTTKRTATLSPPGVHAHGAEVRGSSLGCDATCVATRMMAGTPHRKPELRQARSEKPLFKLSFGKLLLGSQPRPEGSSKPRATPQPGSKR